MWSCAWRGAPTLWLLSCCMDYPVYSMLITDDETVG